MTTPTHARKTLIAETIDAVKDEVENAMEDVAGLLEQLKEARKALRRAEKKHARLVARFGEVS